GQTAVGVPAGEVAHDLGHLDDIAGSDLLHVRLVPAGPVGRPPRVGRAQHLEHLLEALFAHDVADADEVDVLGGNLDGQVTLRHLDRKSTRLNSSHVSISYAGFC